MENLLAREVSHKRYPGRDASVCVARYEHDVVRHEERVAALAELICLKAGLGREYADDVRLAARFHDVGKMGVNHDLLFLKGRPTQDQFEDVKKHTNFGEVLLEKAGASQFVVDVAKFHHEKYDGTGYFGVEGEAIPMAARVVAIADVYDALVRDRVYKNGMPEDQAFGIMLSRPKGRCTFDPHLLRVFARLRLEDAFGEGGISPETRDRLRDFVSTPPESDLHDGYDVVFKKDGTRLLKHDDGVSAKTVAIVTPNGEAKVLMPELGHFDALPNLSESWMETHLVECHAL